MLPPVYLLVSIAAMVAVCWFLPGRWIIPFPWTLLGTVPVSSGIALNLAADAAFKKQETTVKPFEESRSLVTSGVYAISRNPMYLGFALILLGIAMFMGAVTPFAVIPFFVAPIETVIHPGGGGDARSEVRRDVVSVQGKGQALAVTARHLFAVFASLDAGR